MMDPPMYLELSVDGLVEGSSKSTKILLTESKLEAHKVGSSWAKSTSHHINMVERG